MAKKYVLRRNADGKLIETASPTTANDLVANGVAKMVRESEVREEAAPKRKPVVEPKADDTK